MLNRSILLTVVKYINYFSPTRHTISTWAHTKSVSQHTKWTPNLNNIFDWAQRQRNLVPPAAVIPDKSGEFTILGYIASTVFRNGSYDTVKVSRSLIAKVFASIACLFSGACFFLLLIATLILIFLSCNLSICSSVSSTGSPPNARWAPIRSTVCVYLMEV